MPEEIATLRLALASAVALLHIHGGSNERDHWYPIAYKTLGRASDEETLEAFIDAGVDSLSRGNAN